MDIKCKVFMGAPIFFSPSAYMSSPTKLNMAMGKMPVPDIIVVLDEESEVEDKAEIEWQAKEAKRKVMEDREAHLEAAKAKAQCQKEQEEAKAKVDC